MSVKRITRLWPVVLIGWVALSASGCASTAGTLNPFQQMAARLTGAESGPVKATPSDQKKAIAEPRAVTPASYVVRDKAPAKSNCKTEGG